MAERYERLFSLPGEFYTPGAPLLIVAGILQRDTANGKLLALLKLKNLDDRSLSSVKARLRPLDLAGRPSCEPVEQVLHLDLGKGESSVAQTIIPIPGPTTSFFRPELLEAVFTDGSIWSAPEGAEWQVLPGPQRLETVLEDEELLTQLRIARGQRCRFLPARYGELWRCTCGELNRGETCSRCRGSYFVPKIEALRAGRDVRLAEEKAAREKADAERRLEAIRMAAARERAEAEQRLAAFRMAAAREQAEEEQRLAAERKRAARKTALFLVIGIPVLVLLNAAVILLGIPGFQALQARSAAREGDYVRAEALYQSVAGHGLFDFLFHAGQKAEKLGDAARYQEGMEALAQDRYEDAMTAFEAAGDYRDAGEQILRVWLLRGDAAAADGHWIEAIALYEKADGYGDAEAKIAGCTAGVVKEAATAGDLETAELYYAKIEKTAETRLLLGELDLYLARAYALACKPGRASSLLNDADYDKDDESLAELANEARYYAALSYLEEGQYLASAVAFRSLADYRDSAHLVQSARLAYLNQAFEQEQYQFLASRAEEIDKSLLSGEELDSYQDTLYSAASQLENSGEYAEAFTLYQLSGKGDYQSRMDACNKKYIQTPFVFSNAIYSSGDWVKITGVSALYHSGVVTFTVSYSCSTSFNLYYNQNRTRVLAKFLNAGASSFSFDIDYSSLLESSNHSVNLSQFEFGGANSSMSLPMDSILKLSTDLYGNPIP